MRKAKDITISDDDQGRHRLSLLPSGLDTQMPEASPSTRALLRRRRSLARLRARRRRRWGWGWRSVTPRVTRVTRARVNVITARHRRFSFPPCTTGTRALQRRRRSLAPSIPRLRARGVAVAMAVAVGHATRDARNVRHASRIRTRMSSPRIAHVITVFRSPRARPARARCSGGGARSLPRLRARGVAVVMAVAVGHAARDARDARHAFACARHHRVSRASSEPLPRCQPCARAAFARSLICCCVRRHAAHRTCARDLGARGAC